MICSPLKRLAPLLWILAAFCAVAQSSPNLNYATPYFFSTFAGNPRIGAERNGTNAYAWFDGPNAAAFDRGGTLYVADASGGRIRRVTAQGVVTFAGITYEAPEGIAVDANTNIYVACEGGNTIDELVFNGSNWTTTVIAGRANKVGTNDGPGTSAQFNGPNSVAVDANTNIYVADEYSHTIRLLTPTPTNWIVSTIAGTPGVAGTNDGVGSEARFNQPVCLTVDNASNLYVTEWLNDTVRKITPLGTNWVVQRIAGQPGAPGAVDGPGDQALFASPSGIALDPAGNLYVTDQGNNLVRKIAPQGTNWMVTTLAGSPGVRGTNDGVGSSALFYFNAGIAVDQDGHLFVADTGNNTIRRGYFPEAIEIGASLTNGVAPLTVEWMAPGRDAQSNAITGWTWTFGDGTGGSNENPSVTYSNAGIYRVVLYATNTLGSVLKGNEMAVEVDGDGYAAPFSYSVNAGVVTVTGYGGGSGFVNIPATINGARVTEIGPDTFAALENLTVVSAPGDVSRIDADAFKASPNLLAVLFAGDAPAADPTAFTGDTNARAYYQAGTSGWAGTFAGLAAEALPFDYAVSNNAFTLTRYEGGAAVIAIPNGVTALGTNVFQNAAVTDVTLPNSVAVIGNEAFDGCTNLTNVTAVNGLTAIGYEAFGGSRLTSFYVPATATNLAYSAFYACTMLTNIAVDPQNAVYSSMDGILYDKAQKVVCEIPDGVKGTYVAPNDVEYIGPYAFDPACSVTNVFLPASLTTIVNQAFYGSDAVQGVYFEGPEPVVYYNALISVDLTFYFIPGMPGWTAGGNSQYWMLPNPVILRDDGNFGIQNGTFGFTVSWATNEPVVVEACDDLSNPTWQALDTNATDTANTGTFYFSEPLPSGGGRFYRLVPQ